MVIAKRRQSTTSTPRLEQLNTIMLVDHKGTLRHQSGSMIYLRSIMDRAYVYPTHTIKWIKDWIVNNPANDILNPRPWHAISMIVDVGTSIIRTLIFER